MTAERRARSPQALQLILLAGLLLAAGIYVGLRSLEEARIPVVQRAGSRWEPLAGRFAGADACRECHDGIVRAQLSSAHANTLRELRKAPPRSRLDTGQGVADPDTGARYEMVTRGGRPAISVQRSGLEAHQEVHYEFGAGRHAFAYVADLGDNQYLDARLNFYRKIDGWGFTSGQEAGLPTLTQQPLGRPLGPADAALCFSCHATYLKANGVKQPGTPGSEVRLELRHSRLGITCEGCHGPKAEHVRRWKSGRGTERAAQMTALQINEMCARCHNAPEIDPAAKGVARFQPYGLARSECFKKSAGRLSCLTCHDPHADSPRDVAFYEAKCRGCHSSEAGGEPFRLRTCPVNPRDGCVGCHMPADDRSMLHVTFRDHFIRITSRRVERISKD
jgi:hypothetical protein